MPALYQAIITKKGLNLRSKAEAGKYGIEFTKAVTGSGVYDPDENLQEKNELKNPRQEFGFSKREYVDDATSMLQVIVTNTNLEEGYYVREIGVFAMDPDEGEILYSLSLAVDNKWDYLPEHEWGAAMIELEIETAVSNAEKVTITAKMDALASADDLNSLREPEFEDYNMSEEAAPDLEESIHMIKSGKHLKLLIQHIKASLLGLLKLGKILNAGENIVEFEDYSENGNDIPDPEYAIGQVVSGKTEKVFKQYVKAALKGLLNLAQKALSIATGKNQARVFATVEALDTWLAVPENVQQLKVGDNFYIIATEVPDYWWDGRQKQKLETQKVDLTTYDQRIAANASAISELNGNISSHKSSGDHDGRYYTEAEVNALLTGKADTSHSHNYLLPVWENYDVTIYTNNFQGSIYVYKRNGGYKQILIHGSLLANLAADTGGRYIANLPDGAKPDIHMVFPGITKKGKTIWIHIIENGEIYIENYSLNAAVLEKNDHFEIANVYY